MPARYFHFSQNFNADPEGWEFTDTFGDRALRTWHEVLSILDRENNRWKLVEGWDSVIARKVRQAPATVRREVDWMLARGWLAIGQLLASGQPEVLYAPKYGKYRKSPGAVGTPPNLPSLPNHPKDAEPAKPAPSADLKKQEPRKLDPAIKAGADPIYLSNPEKFSRLIVWIKDKEKRDYPAEVITTTLRAFWVQEQKSKVADWWPYMNRIFTKEFGRWNEEQAQKHKSGEADFVLRKLVNFAGGGK